MISDERVVCGHSSWRTYVACSACPTYMYMIVCTTAVFFGDTLKSLFIEETNGVAMLVCD